MAQKLEDKIKILERELALKQAYLSVDFSFPKGSKLPQDVKDQVIAELRSACTQLAEDVENSDRVLRQKEFSDEDIKVLQELVAAVRTKKAQPSPSASVAQPSGTTVSTTPVREEVRKALVMTTDNVNASMRNKVPPQAEVFVRKINDGKAVVMTKDGIVFQIPEEDLDFEV